MRRFALRSAHHRVLQTSFFCTSSPQCSNGKLFVGGLSWYVDEKSLKEAFSSFGEISEAFVVAACSLSSSCSAGSCFCSVSVRIMYDKSTGRSRGFGFVHFTGEEGAKSAKDAMDGKALLGRPLRISFALDKVRGTPLVVPRASFSGDSKEC